LFRFDGGGRTPRGFNCADALAIADRLRRAPDAEIPGGVDTIDAAGMNFWIRSP
jgi:hypothetical protein